MLKDLKPELDKLFEKGAQYGQDALNTPQGVIYDLRISELTDEFWDDLRNIMLKTTNPTQTDQFLSDFQEELRQKYPYLSRVEAVRPLFDEATQRAGIQ